VIIRRAEKFQVQTLNNISARGIELFSPNFYDVNSEHENPHAILVRSANLLEMSPGSNLLVVGRAGAGTNNIPTEKLTSLGIPVFNTPGANANAVKELVLAGLLMSARNIPQSIEFVGALDATSNNFSELVEGGKKKFAGFELPGKTLGVIGLGMIGSLVADVALKLGMRVIGFDPGITIEAAWSLPAGVSKASSIGDLARKSDFLTLHVPLNESTRSLVNKELLSKMRKDSVVLNFSRGGVVDNGAISEAIEAGRLRQYICDFPNPSLLGMRGVISLPHLGASTKEAEENCALMVVSQIIDYLDNGNVVNSVNFPRVLMPRESEFRLAIINANVPNMLGQISTALAEQGLNIHNMINNSSKEIALTLVDVDSPISDTTLETIKRIEGVRSLRYLPRT
jgi:D-3-phosphoglycerate dehydrogenase